MIYKPAGINPVKLSSLLAIAIILPGVLSLMLFQVHMIPVLILESSTL